MIKTPAIPTHCLSWAPTNICSKMLLIYSTRIVGMNGNSLRTAPKFIVFLSQMLLLFKFCHFCKADSPRVATTMSGTMVIIKSFCINPSCMKENIWRSQPQMTGTKIPAGNILLNMATLLAGGSISKIIQIFKHMNLGVIAHSTFFTHQRVRLFVAEALLWPFIIYKR